MRLLATAITIVGLSVVALPWPTAAQVVWRETESLPADEAHQAAAADGNSPVRSGCCAATGSP
jgi:hypothetical protein